MAAFGVVTLSGALAVGVASPALASTSAPVAVGAGSFTDQRVWEVASTAAGSSVRMSGYRIGQAGLAVDNQRWQWELVDSNATAGLTWRIHNVASGLCLDKNTGNAVVLSGCSSAPSQRWRAPLDDPNGGWTLVNTSNSQCLAVPSITDGALLQTANCSGDAMQRWRMRPAPQDCTVRSRDWTSTDVCASQSSERMVGVTANWRSYPLRMNWLDPNIYVLTNTTNTYVSLRPLKPDFSPSYTGVEFGGRAERSIDPTGTVAYSAYWLEWGETGEKYHGLTAEQAPRSDTADGRNHTFMLLGKGNAGQWDLLYDYNTIGTTSLAAGGSTRESRAGLAVRYPKVTTTDTPFSMRMQLMGSNKNWRRPYLTETGTGEPKTCERPPRYEDFGNSSVNLPPNCFSAAYTTRAPQEATSPTELDAFTVGKPATSASAVQRPAVPLSPVSTYRGVDQQALASCLESDAGNCVDQVPGLADCVAARAVCNVTAGVPTVSQRSVATVSMTADEAVALARRTFRAVNDQSPPAVTVMPGGQAARTFGAPGLTVPATTYVVTSSALVRSLSASNPTTYPGYVAVYDASTKRLLYACLGADCGRTS